MSGSPLVESKTTDTTPANSSSALLESNLPISILDCV